MDNQAHINKTILALIFLVFIIAAAIAGNNLTLSGYLTIRNPITKSVTLTNCDSGNLLFGRQCKGVQTLTFAEKHLDYKVSKITTTVARGGKFCAGKDYYAEIIVYDANDNKKAIGEVKLSDTPVTKEFIVKANVRAIVADAYMITRSGSRINAGFDCDSINEFTATISQ